MTPAIARRYRVAREATAGAVVHEGRYDKTPAGDADEGPVKRKAQADEPGPYEAPQVRCRRYESGL